MKNQTTFEKFRTLAESGEIIPVAATLAADLETPVSVLRRFAGDEQVFLLESVEGGERSGRYSFLGVRPRGVFRIENGQALHTGADGETRILPFAEFPLDALRPLLGGERFVRDPELPPLPGGAVGFLGYEAVGMFEELPVPKTAPRTPEALFMLTDRILAFDNFRHTLKLISCVHTRDFPDLQSAYDSGIRDLEELRAVLASPPPQPSQPSQPRANAPEESTAALESSVDRPAFCKMVEAARNYIRRGDAIQIVLSRRFSTRFDRDPFEFYRALRLVNPSPYTFFMKFGDLALAGSSPETLVKLSGRVSTLRPIAGTRKRGESPAEDRKLADELLADGKERAEHLMLVDLGRNDLGRTAAPGSVQVKSFMNVERYSHVMHLVSEVEAVLADGFDAIDLIRTAFPAGTLSGAPKIRAMELIRELEPESRGVYGGAAGYLSYDGSMDLAITIRTAEIRAGELHVQAGAGIVADSVPELEFEETRNKAAAIVRALELARNGLNL